MEKTSIRQIRHKRGLTQEALAELMQVDVTTVQRWEMGKSSPICKTSSACASCWERPTG